MVGSTVAALGLGTRKQVARRRLRDKMALNFLGHSFASRMLHFALPKKAYAKCPDILHSLLRSFKEDALEVGASSCFKVAGSKFSIRYLGLTADWPAHVKAGKLKRSFYNLPKQYFEKTRCTGICDCCHAGQPEHDFEDMSMDASYLGTIGLTDAFDADDPGELLDLMNYEGASYKMFKSDLFHIWSLGWAKEWVAGMIVITLDIVPGTSVPAKLQLLTLSLEEYCLGEKGVRAPCGLSFNDGLTRDRVGWSSFKDWPKGAWQKATDSRILGDWLVLYLDKNKDAALAHPLLSIGYPATKAFITLLSELYGYGCWIYEPDASLLAETGLAYCQSIQKIAAESVRLKLNRFKMQPKIRKLRMIWQTMYQQAKSHGVAQNPLMEAVQQSEDYIGQVSRTSRRVSPRLTNLRSLEAYCAKLHRIWQLPHVFGQEPPELED